MIFRTKEELIRYVKTYTNSNIIIGITSGCFDLLHPLQVEYLNKCRKMCDVLVVLIDSDNLLFQNKSKYPLINENDGAFMVDNLKSTDICMVFSDLVEYSDVLKELGNIPITVLQFKHNSSIYNTSVIGTTYPNIQLVVIPDVIRFQSTTEITNHLKQEDVKC